MYRYETHMHTCQSSACGRSTGAEHARFYKERGYTGIIITDHFFGGNTAAPRRGDWKDRIEAFCAGYKDAKAEGDRIGLDVFFAWEETFEGDDYLVYGLDEEWLLAHPEVEHWTRQEQFEQVHRDGGCVIQAHPFRCWDYIHAIHLGLDLVDGVEVANGGNLPLWDAYAQRYAEEYGLYRTTGSDNHLSQPGKTLFGIGTERRLTDIHDWVDTVLQRKPITLLLEDPDRLVLPEGDRRLPLSCWMHNSKNEKIRYRQPWLQDAR